MDLVEEDLRWEMIHRYRSGTLSHDSIARDLAPGGQWYGHNREQADRFRGRLDEYPRARGGEG